MAGLAALWLRLWPDSEIAWAPLASVALHLLLLALFASVASTPPPVESEIPVEIMTEAEFEAATRPLPAPTPEIAAPAPDAAPPAPAGKSTDRLGNGPPAAAPMIRADRLFAQQALNDPRSASARRQAGRLSREERALQLCNAEAMGQVHHFDGAYQPDLVIAYARAEIHLAGNVLEAEGAAFRSKRRWYAIRYRCIGNADLSRITGFEFAVGAEIPKRLWESDNLPGDDTME